jgi:hypothetical protein
MFCTCKTASRVREHGTALHFGTLYAAAMFVPVPAAALMPAQSAAAQTTGLKAPDPANLTWDQVVEHAPWAPRDSAMTFVFKDKMWILGGLNGNGVKAGPEHAVEYWTAPYFNDIWSSDDGAHWAHEGDGQWAPRRSMTVAEFKGRLWMMGGWTPKVGYTSDIWVSDDAVNWQKIVEQAPWPAREGHTLTVWQGKLWLMGGVNYDERHTYNDVWYSDDGVNWNQAPDAPWSTRWDHAAAGFNGKLYVTGGMDLNKHTFNDVWTTTDGVQWQKVTGEAPWMSRQGHALLSWGGVLYTLGRLNDDTTTGPNDIWYTRDGFVWHKTAEDPPWLGREDHGALVYKNRLWVLSGMDINWHWNNDVWRSSPLSPQPASAPTGAAQAATPQTPTLSAKAAYAVAIDARGGSRPVYAQNEDSELLVASMTKLMTALVAADLYDVHDTVVMDSATLSGRGLSGAYATGDTLTVGETLYALLVASHNEAANALAQKIGVDAFVARMNGRAAAVGMTHTHFANPSGLDPLPGEQGNKSSARDIATLLYYIYTQRPELFAILGTQGHALVRQDGTLVAQLATTDKLLAGQAALPVLGGKTGETPQALQNLALVSKIPAGVLVTVVVGSTNNFKDTGALLNYAKDATR